MKDMLKFKSVKAMDSRLCYEVEWQGRTHELTYKIDDGYSDWLDVGCADGAIVPFIYYAVRFGFDIQSSVPVSSELLFSLNHLVVPELCNAVGNETVHIVAPERDSDEMCGNAVGSGFSGGVDSFATFCEYAVDCDDANRITHLLYFMQGAHDGQLSSYDKDVEHDLFSEQLAVTRAFAEKHLYPVVVLESNLNEVLSSCFGFMSYEWSHSFRNAGMALMLQKHLRRFYYSDAYGLADFDVSLKSDSSHYEKWLLPLLSTNRLTIISANAGMGRIEKTRYISNYKQTYDSLLVCWRSGVNDCTCDKCIRTLVTLDYLGVLDRYAPCFNLDLYRANKAKYLRRVAGGRLHDSFFAEIWRYAKDNGLKRASVFGQAIGFFEYYLSKVKGGLGR